MQVPLSAPGVYWRIQFLSQLQEYTEEFMQVPLSAP